MDVLCLHLLRTHSSIARLAPEATRKGLVQWQVTKIHDYMRDHLDQELGLDELAALLGLSRFHFCTAFRKATGLTPHQFLISMRIARARELLLDPAKPITEIAASVGYQTPSAFSTAFRALEGISPSEFRRRI
jgi:AraC family transcriptional regulator